MKVKRLGDLAHFVMGQAPSSADCNKTGQGVPFVKAGEFGESRPVICEWTISPLKLAKATDVLICVVGATAGKLNLGADCAIGRSVAAIRPGPNLDQMYLFHSLKEQVAKLRAGSQGSAQGVITSRMLDEIRIPDIAIEEQKRIAAILDKADNLRRKRQQGIRLADDFLRAVFLDMFGDPVTNPKGLLKHPLGDLIKLKSGEFLPASEMSSEGSIPVYGGNGINGYHDEKMFDESQIVIGRVGAYCGAVHQTEAPCWVTDNALYVAEKSPGLHSDYLLFALRQANLNQYASQSGQPLVSGGRIYPVEILVPEAPMQDTFAKIIQGRQVLNDSLSLSEIAVAQLGKSLQSNFF